MAKYTVEIITQLEKEKRMQELCKLDLYERKAVIHGTCVKLFTDYEEFKEMWEDNFEPISDNIRPHGRVFATNVNSGKLRVLYEPLSKTILIEGCTYYGWIKSIALGLVADFLEDFTSEHQRHSVHGSFVDKGGRGLAIIGASGSGKTTLTYGLLMEKGFNFLTDDWFFVRLMKDDALVFSSEKNSYIRGDLTQSWPQYSKKLEGIKKDSEDRAIVDVRRLFGSDVIRTNSNLRGSVLLVRDKTLAPFKKLDHNEALDLMVKADFCNPHQLVRTKEKFEKRKKFFSELFSRAPVYLLNTIETPKESLDRLKKLFD